MWHVHATAHVWDHRTILWSWFFPSTFTCVPRMEPDWLALQQVLYLLGHPAAPPSAILKEETVLLAGMTLPWTLTAYGLILSHRPGKITPKLEILFFSSWQFLFLSADESFNIGLKFEIAFEVRPRSSSGTLVHGHSVNGEYLNVHMKNGQVVSWELTVHLV